MENPVCKRPYKGPVKAVVLDWAGTCVDYGSMAPIYVFMEVFEDFGVPVTAEEIRLFMGMGKKEHVREVCGVERVRFSWKERFGTEPRDEDIDRLYGEIEERIPAVVKRHAAPIEGLLDTVAELRSRGILIGTSTGYTAPMMSALAPAAAAEGFVPDNIVCASDVPSGRPYPWMCFKNAIDLQVYPLESIVKIGDTESDVTAGLNAGMWTIGITRTGNELGMSEPQAREADPQELAGRLREIGERFKAVGAHYVAPGIKDVSPLIDDIEMRLSAGERPV
jgi:phosphonoacetaldehyde hydrolase